MKDDADDPTALGPSSAGPFSAGEVLSGRYEVIRLLGRGGMGEVYEVQDRQLNVRVALKTILPETLDDPETLPRFKREILLARRITHRNVCRIFDLGQHGEGEQQVMFLTMELLPGDSLDTRIRQGGRIPEEGALRIARGIAAALDAAHEVGIVHRDLKSANVHLVPGPDGERAVVVDFGLARVHEKAPRGGGTEGEPVRSLTRLTTDHGFLGTPGYMAPEQVRGEPAGPPADIYAFGVVLFEVVTGRLPFLGDSPISVAVKRLNEEPPSPSSLVEGLDPRWEAAILRCLRRDPAERFSAPMEVVEALAGAPAQGDDTTRMPDGSGGAGEGITAPGIRTLLLTDLVGSTEMVESLGDERAAALSQKHDQMARGLLGRYRGREIDKTDGFLLLFDRPADAIGYALAYHRCLHDLSEEVGVVFQARAGIHLGEVHLRENPPEDVARGAKPLEVEGIAKPIAARLMGLAQGGQTLLTKAAFDLARRAAVGSSWATQEMKWLSHGHYLFQGTEEPLSVYEVGIEGEAPLQAPPESEKARPVVVEDSGAWRREEGPAHNLPVQLTSFVGREREREEVGALLATARLVTLTGAGGCGKTRLAVEMAGAACPDHRHGVWMVEMAPLTDPGLVSRAVASVLGLREEPGRPVTETVLEHLQRRTLLLFLDNCEHLLDGCARLVDAVLRSCPGVRILATSREALGIGGETTYPVPPLPVPGEGSAQSPASVEGIESVRLFVERAAAGKPGFLVTEANATAVAGVCRRLDGIPLAIELAAARVRSMSVEQIEARLEDRFRLLRSRGREVLERHQTLRAAMDWSYEHLSEEERVLLARLSVFAGGWSLEAAENVCSDDVVDEYDVLDLLANLLDKSLAVMEEGERASRYRFLQTVKQYARERLEESGEAGEVRGRHLDFYLGVAEEAREEYAGPGEKEALDRLEAEHGNLRAALGWCAEAEDGAAKALRLAGSLGRFWVVHGHLTEGREQMARALERPEVTAASPERVLALTQASALAFRQGDYPEAERLGKEALVISRELGDEKGAAASLHALGNAAWARQEHEEARAHHEESLAIRRKVGDRAGEAASLNNLGIVAVAQGDLATARMRCEESLAIQREIGDLAWLAVSLCNLGSMAHRQGDYDSAREHLEEGLAIQRELGERAGMATSLSNLGAVAERRGEYDPARVYYEESLDIRREIGDRAGTATSLTNLAALAMTQEDHEGARRLLEEGFAIQREIGDRRGVADSLDGLGQVARARGELAEARRLLAESLAIRGELSDREGMIGSLETLAGLDAVGGQAGTAARLLGAAEAAREAIGAPRDPADSEERDATLAALRSSLGEEALEAALTEGRSWTLEQAAEHAAKPDPSGGREP